MPREPLDNLYFNWLCNKVERHEIPTPSLTHWNLLRDLHNTEFVWIAARDNNRAQDGLELRARFLVELGEEGDDWLESMGPIGCSVLEMLIGFCERIPDVVFDHETPREWFWIFMENLGLSHFDDARYNRAEVEEILERFVWREYGYSGHGGIFPLERPEKDQRETELWYQLFAYVEERRHPV